MEWQKLKTYFEAKGKSPRTITKYEYYFNLVPKGLLLKPVKSINDWLLSSSLPISTKHAISSIIRSYFKAISEPKKSEQVMTIDYKSNESDFIITEEQLKKLLFHTKDYQIKLMIKTLFYTGMRLSILLNVTPYMFNDKEGGFDIPKNLEGNKARVKFFIPVPNALKQEILKYIQKYKPKDRIFDLVKYKNEKSQFNYILKQLAKKAHLPLELSAHKLRHSYATYYITKGGRKEILQQNLGHKFSKATDRYVHIKAKSQKEETDRLKIGE